jgi:hypothetical protein
VAQARDHYLQFVNGVTDAVDTGTISSTAQQALQQSRESLSALQALDLQRKLAQPWTR